MELNTQFLKKLCSLDSPSSLEEDISNVIRSEIEQFVDEVYSDTLGNLIAHKKGAGKKLMFAAHMDQIGLMVTDIDENGFLKFSGVGGLIPFTLIGQRVIFKNGVVGIIDCAADLETMQDMSGLKLNKLYIDIGAASKEEASNKLDIGDIGSFCSEYYENENIIISKSIDDKIGCYMMAEVIKSEVQSDYDIYYAFTVQEEVGCRGAVTAAYQVEPDIGIALDITPAGDCPGTKNSNTKVNGGAAIKLMDPTIMTHPTIKKLMTDKAKENNIKFQYEIMYRGGTDAGEIHLSKKGAASGDISIPTRHAHTANELIYKSDVAESIKLMKAIIKK